MNLINRISNTDDLKTIVELPENEMALFYMFPKATYPLSAEQLEKVIKNRFESTVFILDKKIIGYANLYLYKDEKEPYIGNVILSQKYRGRGFGKEIVQTMIQKAKEKFKTDSIKIAVFKSNTNVYGMYKSLGFEEFGTEEREDFRGEQQELVFMGLEFKSIK